MSRLDWNLDRIHRLRQTFIPQIIFATGGDLCTASLFYLGNSNCLGYLAAEYGFVMKLRPSLQRRKKYKDKVRK